MPKRKAEEAGIGADPKERDAEAHQARICRQIEFYFGDFNIPFDTFILKECESNGGWFPVSHFTKFKKLQQMECDMAQIIEACAESEILELNEEQTMVKRKKPAPEKAWVHARTIQASGFPKENNKLDNIVAWFQTICKEVRKVKFCGYNSGVFWVSFSTTELCDEYMKNDKNLEYQGNKITLGKGLYSPPTVKKRRGGGGRGRGRGGRGRGGRGRGGHSRGGKRMRMTDHIPNKDMLKAELGIDRASDIVPPPKAPGEPEVDEWEKRAAAERAALGLDKEGNRLSKK